MKDILGNKIISISREISKVYEEVFRGTIDEALNIYIEAKGEFVIVIDNNEKNSNLDEAFLELQELVEYGMNKKSAMKYVSKKHAIGKNVLYNMFEEKKV